MITAVDTNVLLDVFAADPEHGSASRAAVKACLRDGGLCACAVVVAEVAAAFEHEAEALDSLQRLGVAFSAIDEATAAQAGRLFHGYRRQGGARRRIIPDFLIGAHAAACADRLLTRDRGFYRAYFSSLTLIDPAGRR